MADQRSPHRTPVTIQFEAQMLANLRELAEQEERSLSAQLRLLVARGLRAEYEEE